MAAFGHDSSSDSDSDNSRDSSSTPTSGYVQVGLWENTSLSFEKNHAFLNWLLLFVLLGGTSICAALFYYAVPLRHELTATVRSHLGTTPFKAGDAALHWAWTGGWLSTSSFSRAVELRHISSNTFVRPEAIDLTIASGAVATWADVEAWLLTVLAPTLYTGSLGGAVVVQVANLRLTKGSLSPNEDTNTKGVVYQRLTYDVSEEKTVDFGETLGGTYGVDATAVIQALRAEGWWGPLTIQARMMIRGRDGIGNECVAEVLFEQQPSGIVTATVNVATVLISNTALAFAFSSLFLVAAIAYNIVEWAAFKVIKKTRLFDDDRSPLFRYLEDRWPCAFVAVTSVSAGALMLTCSILSNIITHSEFNHTAVDALEVMEGVMGVLLMMNGWAFMLRMLHALSGASIFFLVMEKSIAVVVNEFGGILIVALLLLLGASACNFILLGPRVPQFQSFGSSIFYTACMSFGAPFIYSMPPVAFIVTACGLLVFWVVIVPLLVAVNIQSFSTVVKKVRTEERDSLGYEVIGKTQEWMQNNLFFCTPDPKDHRLMDEELRARLREQREEKEAANTAKLEHLEERGVRVSQAEDAATSEYRKLVLVFVPFVLFFAMAICFLCDTPRVHREYEQTHAAILQPFNTTDPFETREANISSPPVWMIPNADCNPSPRPFPATQPQGVRRPLQITSVRSLGGVYDWLEQVLAGQILNAAFNSPTTTNAIPLTNPGAVLNLTRVEVTCQTFDPILSLYPVRRKRATFRNWTTNPFGNGDFHANADRVYMVPIYFSGTDPPTTAVSVGGTSTFAADGEGERRLSAQSSSTNGGIPRGLSQWQFERMQGSDINWTAADFQEIYAGPASMRTKMEALRAQKFLDWQLGRLDVIWMAYNGDDGMFVLNRVRVAMNEGGLKTSLKVTVVPHWHVNPFKEGVRPEVVFMPLALVFLIAYLLLSYTAVQKRRLQSLYLIILDLPLALSFACCCFFLLCMYNVAFDPGWVAETSLLAPGSSAAGTGHIPKFVPGPVQPWQWLPGSSNTPSRAQPPPSAESLQRFLRIQEHLEIMAKYLLFCKICAGLLFVIAVIRFITMVPAIPGRLQGLRKLLSHLNAAKMQTACTLCSLFTTFLLFCLVGYCVLGGSYEGFSTFANAVVSCVMATHAKWNFNSTTTVAQQGRSIDWHFEVFILLLCLVFFGFMNYIVLSMVYVRYESLKAEEATEMQSALEAKYGVVQRKRVPLLVNDLVILYFKAFVKCLSLHAWGKYLDGEELINPGFANLKDEFFISLKEHPIMVKEPRNTQEYISKALLSTQVVRLQQGLTDIEFLRAKHYLILHDLGVIDEQMKVLRQVTRRQGKYVAGIEAAIQHVNKEIESVQTRKAFISYYNQQDPMHARQQLEQQQLLDLGMDAGREYARRAIADPQAYVPPELLDAARWEEPARQELIEEQRLRHIKENTRPPTLHEVRKKRMKGDRTKEAPEEQAPKVESPRVTVAGIRDPVAALQGPHAYHVRGGAPWKGRGKPAVASDAKGTRYAAHEDSDEDDWDNVRQRFGGDRQGTIEIRGGDGNVLLVTPFTEPTAGTLPTAAITRPRKQAARSSLHPSESGAEKGTKTAPAYTPSGVGGPPPITTFFASPSEDEGPRPLTNAPEIAQGRALDLTGLRQRPTQEHKPHRRRSRRAHVNLQTFEAGGQDFRILPRRRGKEN